MIRETLEHKVPKVYKAHKVFKEHKVYRVILVLVVLLVLKVFKVLLEHKVYKVPRVQVLVEQNITTQQHQVRHHSAQLTLMVQTLMFIITVFA